MARNNITPSTTTNTEPSEDAFSELLARLLDEKQAQIDSLQADVKLLIREVIRLERHEMIGINPDLIDREKA